MSEHESGSYGDVFADVYDDWYGDVSDVNGLIRLICETVGTDLNGLKVLECGVGTGRVALPLAKSGAHVTGIDASDAMLDRLRLTDPEELITVVHGDMVKDIPNESFDVAIVAFNTLFNLLSFQRQAEFFVSIADHLVDGGILVVEATVMGTASAASSVAIKSVSADSVVVSVSCIDPESQTAHGRFVEIRESGNVERPWRIRYSDPDELDAMARAANLVLVQRTENPAGVPFTKDSERHVSVYQRPILNRQ